LNPEPHLTPPLPHFVAERETSALGQLTINLIAPVVFC
jgi:hypothetical protein